MIEHERTFLAKGLPDLSGCEHEEMIDIYVPASERHPILRIRKKGENREITKKSPEDGDASKQTEHTIILTEDEFVAFGNVDGKRVSKIRYYYPFEGRIAEIDVFTEGLEGLVLVDVEFDEEDDKHSFQMPDFCLADVTHEEFIAGGMLCGKGYSDIEKELDGFGYKKIQR